MYTRRISENNLLVQVSEIQLYSVRGTYSRRV